MLARTCSVRRSDGSPCRATPLRDSNYCLMHDPDHHQEMQEARRLGGLRRKREVTVTGAYDLSGLDTVAGLRRLLDIAVHDALGLENSIARVRAIGYLVGIGGKLLQEGELEERMTALEASVQGQKVPGESVFDVEQDTADFSDQEETTDD
ncbi:MAG: hypothetical protein ACE5Q6_06810 [Dehalococcoidia bacterium]